MAMISWHPKDGKFKINSEDYVNHTWGDFIILTAPVELEIDGRFFYFVPSDSKKQWLVFHRDSEGIIDHFYEAAINPENTTQLEDCPFCGKPSFYGSRRAGF